jgi:hypothetical protein
LKTKRDFEFTFSSIEALAIHYPNKVTWSSHLSSEKWRVETDPVWTLGYPFCDIDRLNAFDNSIGSSWHEIKRESSLAIFKGDLNYRKLVNDVFGKCKFDEAIGELSGAGVPILALRTCKSEPMTGLKEGQGAALDSVDVGWRINGKFGVIQFFESD